MHKILFITYNLDSYSGAAYQAHKLAEQLKDHDTHIVICNFTKRKKLNFELKKQIPVYNLHPSGPHEVLRFIRILVKHRIKIVHFHVFLKKFLLLCVLLNKRVILKTTLIGDDDFETVKKSKMKYITDFILSRITTNVVLSNHAKAINSRFISDSKITKIPNAVDLPSEIGLEEKDPATFCTVGVVCERKQTLEIIRYFHAHYAKLEKSSLYVIGPNASGDNVLEYDQDYYNHCLEYVRANKLEKKVVFTGKLSRNEVNTYYRRSKAFLFFSLKEGLPNVVLEAMSSNCIPIVTEMDGVSYEIIQSGLDGFILKDPGSEIIDAVLLDQMISSGSCQKKIGEKFSLDDLAKRYRSLYNESSAGKFA